MVFVIRHFSGKMTNYENNFGIPDKQGACSLLPAKPTIRRIMSTRDKFSCQEVGTSLRGCLRILGLLHRIERECRCEEPEALGRRRSNPQTVFLDPNWRLLRPGPARVVAHMPWRAVPGKLTRSDMNLNSKTASQGFCWLCPKNGKWTIPLLTTNN